MKKLTKRRKWRTHLAWGEITTKCWDVRACDFNGQCHYIQWITSISSYGKWILDNFKMTCWYANCIVHHVHSVNSIPKCCNMGGINEHVTSCVLFGVWNWICIPWGLSQPLIKYLLFCMRKMRGKVGQLRLFQCWWSLIPNSLRPPWPRKEGFCEWRLHERECVAWVMFSRAMHREVQAALQKAGKVQGELAALRRTAEPTRGMDLSIQPVIRKRKEKLHNLLCHTQEKYTKYFLKIVKIKCCVWKEKKCGFLLKEHRTQNGFVFYAPQNDPYKLSPFTHTMSQTEDPGYGSCASTPTT